MRAILLSFDEKWYPALRAGEKIYEHRKRFCNEPVRAFVYLGKPRQEIVAEICLDKRESLEEWLNKYAYDIKACARIKDFMTRNKYAMKVKWFKEIVPIPIAEVQELFPEVSVPLSFHDLDKKRRALDWLDKNKKYTGYEIVNDFSEITSEDICII